MNGIHPYSALQVVGDVAMAASRYLPEPLSSGMQVGASVLSGGNMIDISPSYQALIERQIQVQQEQQQVTFTSNIEKSQHESRMAAVRNLRVG